MTAAGAMNERSVRQETGSRMSDADFRRLSTFIYDHCGIKMPPVKITMLEARLQKRLRLLGITSFRQYCALLFESPTGGDELVHMIDAVTTNKTDFFREAGHFDFLTGTVVPEFLSAYSPSARPPFIVWSAACSSGEEPYTLAIVLSEAECNCPGLNSIITATDISTRMLDKARAGIYDESQISMIPLALKQRCFLRSKDRSRGLVRVVPELRGRVRFQRLNLMDQGYPFPAESVTALFCRNVIIYFDRPTQSALLARLCRYIRKDGYLFLGHSETVHGFDLPLVRVTSTIYRKVS
jgi:chemotaxis protein methyltransferase CheR